MSANLIAHCLQIHMGNYGNLQANIAKAVDNAVALIDAAPEYHWSIHLLARQVGTNECYLKKGFRERLGMGIASYVRQKRMQQALNLLEKGRLSIGDIALYVGYNSATQFARAFQQYYHYLPSQIRKWR